MKDWENGVEHTTAEALIAKDKWENFLLKIQEAKAIAPIQDIIDLEKRVMGYIEVLREEVIKLKM
jgi:hypothetical protein